ncbi:protein kinase domain-containing protein [Candidatus Lokiarchaeum ossiferum]|uniref:protein kinase domain-containing protein n=1 Tax=Candidatus Lokiarchaeum ossiferum TaxID=2951803 RepID=UPI00352D71F1
MSSNPKHYFKCTKCNSLYIFENDNPIKCSKCDDTNFQKMEGRFILRCRKCGLTQNKSAFNQLHGQEPLQCQSTTCHGLIKVIELGRRKKQQIVKETSPENAFVSRKKQNSSAVQPSVPTRRTLPSKSSEDTGLPFPKPKETQNVPESHPIIKKDQFSPFPQKEKDLKKLEKSAGPAEKDHPGIKEGDNLRLKDDFYEITTKLGTGGMGSVWSARNLTTNKKVAIKEFYYSRFHDPESGNNFCEKYWTREATITKIQSDSPEATMHFIGSLKLENFRNPEYYIFLEYIEGTVFDSWYNNKFKDLKNLSVKELRIIIKDVLMPIARHMYFVHQKGIVHRDLTVQNIMIVKKSRYSDEEVKPVIIDWGVAKNVGVNNMFQPRKPYYISSAPEATGIRNRGTPPEVMAGFEPIAATDIYMLGHIMFYIFSGGHYAGAAATNEDFVLHPGDFNPDLPSDFSRLVEFMTQYEPADRMENMVKVYDALNYLYNSSETIENPNLAKTKQKQYFLYCDYNECFIPLPEGQIVQLGRDEIIAAGTEHSMDGHLYNALIPIEGEKFMFEIFINEGYAFIRDFHSKLGSFICQLTTTNQQVYDNISIKGLDNVSIQLSEANLGTTRIEVPFLAPDGITYRIEFKIYAKEEPQ